MKQKLLLLAAVFFGIMAFMLTYQQINREKSRIQAAAKEVVLLMATQDISEDQVISEDSFKLVKVKRFANQLASSREVTQDEKNLIIGRKAQFQIARGSFIQWNDLQNSVSGGRSGANRMIQNGYRAVAISVDQTASVAGLVQPNNYVDVIGTFKFPGMRGDSELDTITLTLLQHVRVIAVGNDYGERPAGQTVTRNYGTVTLELLPHEVEMVLFAAQKGTLQLSLRNFEDSVVRKDIQSVNWKYLQDNIQNFSREREKKSGLR